MAFDYIKITFILDGNGIIYDKFNPIHFDGIIDQLLSPMNRTVGQVKKNLRPGETLEDYGVATGALNDVKLPVPERDERPYEFNLPIRSSFINGQKVYHASALFPQGGVEETVQYFRTKFPLEQIEYCVGTANLQSGLTRDHNNPYTVTLCREMVCYVVGKYKKIRQTLYKTHDSEGNQLPEKKFMIDALDKKRKRGMGGISDITVEKVDYDWSLYKNGKAQRYLPDPEGMRLCRVRPPYWNIWDAVNCCDVGDGV